jgi:alanine dehydrogenase
MVRASVYSVRTTPACFRLITSQDLAERVTMAQVVSIVRESYRLDGLGRVTMEPRCNLTADGTPTSLKVMPAILPDLGAAGVYVYTGGNRRGHAVKKVALLFSTDDGRLMALVESDWLSWMRTGAGSAVATDALSRIDASRLGIIGSGRQARSQLMAVAEVRRLREVRVYSPNAEHRGRFAREMSDYVNLTVLPVSSSEEVVVNSDILCIATTSEVPVLDGRLVQPGTHINAIGSHSPDSREVDTALVARARIVVDSLDRALKEDGELLIPLREGAISRASISAELGEVVAGRKPGRENNDEVTLFSSGGLSAEYVALAAGIFALAEREGIGRQVPL